MLTLVMRANKIEWAIQLARDLRINPNHVVRICWCGNGNRRLVMHRAVLMAMKEWDPDRLYAILDDGRWVVIQYYGLRNIIVDKNFFFTEILIDN